MNGRAIGALLASVLAVAGRVGAEPDDARQARLALSAPEPRWQNVTGAPRWLGGEPLRRAFPGALHEAQLAPDDRVTIRVPAGERVRAYRPDGALGEADLEFSWSNGTGLAIVTSAVRSADGTSLTADSPIQGESLVTVARPARAATGLRVAFFVSRYLDYPEVSRYRRELVPVHAGQKRRVADEEGFVDYWTLDPGGAVAVDVTGPVRIAVRSLLPFADQGAPLSQSYRIYSYLDGQLWHAQDAATLLDTASARTVDGCRQPIGSPVTGYLDIPAGSHRLELRAWRQVYVRLVAAVGRGDFLFAGNRIKAGPAPADRSRAPGAEQGFWSLSDAEVRSLQADVRHPSALAYRTAARVAQDNGRRHGGLVGAMAITGWADAFPSEPAYRRLASRRYRLHTTYRDLIPETLGPDRTLVYARFLTPTLADHEDGPLWIPESYTGRLASTLPGGYFFRVGSTHRKAQRFLLPARDAPSVLRISVDRSTLDPGAALFLQYDRHTPIELRVDAASVAPAHAFRPSAADAAAAMLRKRFGPGVSTLAAAIGTRTEPAPWVSVAHLEIPLPEAVGQVRLWGSGGEGLRVALAFRDSRSFLLPEAGIQALLAKVGPQATQRLFTKVLPHRPSGQRELPEGLRQEVGHAGPELRDAYIDLYNQWLPLLRLLHARNAVFEAGVAATETAGPPGEPVDGNRREETVRKASTAERAGEWLLALEHWSRLWHSQAGGVREQARRGQIRALEHLGKAFLAKQLLRHDLLHGDTESLRRSAFDRLLAQAQRTGDTDRQLSLLAATVVRHADPRNLGLLADALLASGRSRFALMLLMALPPSDRPLSLVVEAAYLEEWWTVFEEHRRRLPDEGEQHMWAGYRAQRSGDYARAREHWQHTGPSGEALLAHLDEALSIREELQAGQRGRRATGLARWADWQATTPGRQLWQPIPQAVAALEATELLYLPDQNLHVRVARTGPDIPLDVAVYGPAVLRFRVRPLHADMLAGEEAIDDWILLGDGTERYPIVDNGPASGVELLGRRTTRPGRAVELLYEIPPGYHTLSLRTADRPAVVETEVLRSGLPFTVLPPLNPYAARAALDGGFAAGADETGEPFSWRPFGQEPGACGAGGRTVERAPDPGAAPTGGGVLGVSSARWFEGALPNPQDASAGRVLWGYGPGRTASDATGDAVLERLSTLLWRATRDPAEYPGALVEAELLFRANPTVAGAERIVRRLRRGAKWEPVANLQGGAGVRLVEIDGWLPESPELRVHRALMRPLAPGEQVIAGHDVLTLAVDQPRDSEFVVRLRMEDVAHQPSHDVNARVVLDDEPWRQVRLTPEQPFRDFVQPVGAGVHALSVGIQEPLMGQYLRIGVAERQAQGAEPVIDTQQRTYHVATPDEPLTVYVEGPTLLRIHEWRDGEQLVRYEAVATGWQQVVVNVPAGQEEGLYRIYRQTPDPERRVDGFRASGRRAQEVPAAYWESLPAVPQKQSPSDSLPFVGQEDGTWTFGVGVARRRFADDEPSQFNEADEYLEAGITYRRFDEDRETYYRWGGLIREREHGNPTLGLNGEISIQKQAWPVDVDIWGSLFLQQLDQTGELESAATLKVRVSDRTYWGPEVYHRPFLAAFKRWLTLRDYPALHPEQVDQDVFTRYKHDHRQGLQFGDLVVYRPWIDSLFYAGAALASNDRFDPFDPDYARARVGAKALLGDVAVGFDYSWYHYFADDDRDESRDTQRLRVDIVSAGWWNPRNGWIGNVRYEYDQDSGDSSFWLSLGWNHGNERYFRDFRPGEIDFIPLRQQRALEQTSGSRGD